MRLYLPVVCACCAFLAATAKPPEEPDFRLIFTGDIRGYLSPCGCAKPQIGGVLRLAGVVRALKQQADAVYVDLGNWTEANGRQDELKAEGLAEVFASLEPAALNLGPLDLRLGRDMLLALNDSSGKRFMSYNTDLPNVVRGVRTAGTHCAIAGAMPDSDADRFGMRRASARDLFPDGDSNVILFSGEFAEAKSLAEDSKSERLIIFSRRGDPTMSPIREGRVTFVSVGDKGRYVGYIENYKGEWRNLRMISLGPEHHDDERASAAYRAYLSRVTSERLLETLPRSDDGEFVGSAFCASCHVNVHEVWLSTSHATALATLDKTGNDRDPECVGCHVVGLSATSGFRDRAQTPKLAGVGCESCHGAGGKHLNDLYAAYGKAGEASCAPCHNTDHSPEFEFAKYWEKIKH
jgi:hypothetical protein